MRDAEAGASLAGRAKSAAMSALQPAYSLYYRSALWRARHPRRFQAYCVGISKSGTHSLAGLFRSHYTSAHEPEAERLVDTIVRSASASAGRRSVERFLRERDKRLWLEFEASHLLNFFVDILVRQAPDARFILTVRDCYSWLDSQVNQHLAPGSNAPELQHWGRLNDFRFGGPEARFTNADRVLADYGLYPAGRYLAYWADHNRRVLDAVPEGRLLVVKTREIASEARRIADFIGIPANSLDLSKAHSFKRKHKRLDTLSVLDREYLDEVARHHCGDLMARFFPDIKGVDDVVRTRSHCAEAPAR